MVQASLVEIVLQSADTSIIRYNCIQQLNVHSKNQALSIAVSETEGIRGVQREGGFFYIAAQAPHKRCLLMIKIYGQKFSGARTRGNYRSSRIARLVDIG